MKKKNIVVVSALLLAVLALVAFKPLMAWRSANTLPEVDEVEKAKPVGPTFCVDSAMAFCQVQCDFGPRTMNSDAHERCAQWIADRFETYGCKVSLQKADLKGWDGTLLHSTNIMAQYLPEQTTRIVLCAHWDSRPWADNDPDETNHRKPVLAANDGASGVGVMLEIARLLNTTDELPKVGIDFVCFDAEDWGTPQWAESNGDDSDTWALGSAYWSTHLPEGYEARYGILLDMVGGQGAKFYFEQISMHYAPQVVKKVWSAARVVGYGSFFPRQNGGYITDDHIPMNRDAKIPTIDIISYYPDCRQSSFGPTWHTVIDDMDHLSAETLRAVGQTLVQVLWTE